MNQDQKHLLAFLKDWLEWTKNPVDTDDGYRRQYGLCICLTKYCTKYGLYRQRLDIDGELEKLFKADRLSIAFPFGEASFWEAERMDAMHLCPMRLAWVRKTIANLEEPSDWPEDYEVQL